ncbi:S41 family peptidase [Candidatus Hydrogenedentota bacterium]
MKVAIAITVSVLIVALAGASTAFADAKTSSEKERREIVKDLVIEKSYELGTDVTISLSVDEAAQLNCGANPFGLKECFIHRTSSPDVINIVFFNDDGFRTIRGGSSLPQTKAAIRQAGPFPCLSFANWRLEDGKAVISFRIEAERANYSRLHKQYQESFRGAISVYTPYKSILSLTSENASLSETERIAGFARLWSEVKYNFAFFDQIPEVNWDDVLDEYLPKIQKTTSTDEYYFLLMECLAQLQDGHTRVMWPGGGPPSIARGNLPIKVRPYKGKAVIVEIKPEQEIEPRHERLRKQVAKANLKVGEEITHIDGKTVHETLEEDIYRYISASTPQARELTAYQFLLRGKDKSEARLRVKGLDGIERDVTFTRAPISFGGKVPGNFECKDLGDGIVYVNLPSFGSRNIIGQFDEAFPRIKQAKGLIIDVRKNGGGSSGNGYGIIARLIDKPIKGSKWKTRQYMPVFRAWGKEEKWYEGEASIIRPRGRDRFLGPVVVLTAVETFSAAEDFVVALHASKRARIVGGKTGGSTGQPLMIELPGGGRATICTKRDTYPDGRDFVGVGVIPDVEIYPGPADFVAGRDVVLLKGIEELKRMQD